MSAICGILSFANRPQQTDAMNRMMTSLSHHGSDGEGRWQDSNVALGHQMMHTTPESAHEQLPFFCRAASVAVTADARLDNRDVLQRALGIQGQRDLADSELLVAAYLKWGTRSLESLVGEFAFALWDGRNRTLHCCTDPMAIRPLYYLHAPGRYFAFASEVTALLALSDARPALDERRLAMLGVSALSVYLEPEATCFRDIKRVPAASVTTVSGERVRHATYWTPDPGRRLRFGSQEQCNEAFREVFFEALKPRTRSIFPVASLLSGGLDSSSITAAARKIVAERDNSLVTLTAVPEPAHERLVVHERRYAELFSSASHLSMHWVEAAGAGPFDNLERLTGTLSLCSYSYQHFLYSALASTARAQGARVVLDGDGGELSAGCEPRGYLAELLVSGRVRRLAAELRALRTSGRGIFAALKQQTLRPFVPNRVRAWLGRPSRVPHLAPYPLCPDFVGDTLGPDAEEISELIHQLPGEFPAHRRNLVHDLLLERNDLRQRSHAGFVGYQSIQFSYPLLDRRVIEFALAVDGRFKQQLGRGRQLLRQGMGGLVPSKIIQRIDKAPFSPDYLLRYRRQKAEAHSMLQLHSNSPHLKGIVDFDTALAALKKESGYDPKRPMRMDYEAQCTVPYALFMCYFLDRLGSWGQTASRNP